MKSYKFLDEKTYDRVVKLFGEPPCNICLVQPMCIKKKFNKMTGYYVIVLKDACDEAREWFAYGESLGFSFDFHKADDGFWESLDRDDLKKRIEDTYREFLSKIEI